ncbi:exosortase B [Glaciimonas sp. PAMC28666]|uniref:exosortase B n=1 Tax=Glaciimonas sp. PAMC28666 TaxID=2807626 RepID=UPI00351C92FF
MATNVADGSAMRLTTWQNLCAAWWPVLACLLILYIPTFYDLATGLWSTEEQAHGPLILVLATWLIYRQWPQMLKASAGKPVSKAGWVVLLFGLLLYVVGRSQEIALLETGSFVCVLVAHVLLLRGRAALKVQWFPFFFMLFMLPLPGIVVDAMTMPMKMAVSYVVEHILYWMNYPIARSGIILQIGQYQLLVADACAGLHTLFALESLGLLYLNLVRHESLFRNVSLAVFIMPISFISNVIRVMALTLITYYFGDAAGQGFLHGFAGIVLFLSALLLIMGTDSALKSFDKMRLRKRLFREGAAK